MSNLTRRDFLKATTTAAFALAVTALPFSNSKATVAPVDYSDKNNWMRQPEITKDVDTVYIYPTEYIDDSEGAPMFADINEKSMREPAQETYLMQATAYEDSTNVFAPFYRQINMAFASKLSGKDLDAAFGGVPKTDIFAALDYYFKNGYVTTNS